MLYCWDLSLVVVVDSRIFSPVTQIKSHSLLIHVSYKTGMLVKGENQTPYRDLFSQKYNILDFAWIYRVQRKDLKRSARKTSGNKQACLIGWTNLWTYWENFKSFLPILDQISLKLAWHSFACLFFFQKLQIKILKHIGLLPEWRRSQ